MKNLNYLLKTIEIELRSTGNISKISWEKISKLKEWDINIVQAFITEVNLAIRNKNLNFVYKKYDVKDYKINKRKYDLLIVCLKREQHDLILTDVINRLVIPKGISYKYLEIWGMQVEKARNYAVQKCFEMGCKYLLFIDDDIIVENTGLEKLWNLQEKTKRLVVAGNYQKKADYEISAHGDFIDTNYGENIKETNLCAMGFTLINIFEISKIVPAPYFWVFAAPDGYWAMGEDAFFTRNLIEYTNEKPLVDLDISILHYDKKWKRIFGKRNKDITYATSQISTFEEFDHIRVPPQYPLVNICIPTRTKESPIATNLQKLLSLRGYRNEFLNVYDLPVDEARNQLALQSIKAGSEFLFFIDDDVIVPMNSLVRMLEIMESDKEQKIGAITGDYLLKGKVPHSAFLQLNDKGIVTELNRLETDKNEFNSNWLIGLGCCLIRTKVFREIRYPYFKCVNVNKDDEGSNEDAYFSENLFINGYEIKVLNDMKCLHVDFKTANIYGYDKEINYDEYACFEWVGQAKYASVGEV